MNTYLTDTEARQSIIDIGHRMYERQFVAANDGNISIRTGDDRIWVTPSGVSKGYMTEEMLLCVDMEGRVLEGHGKPSSESGMHLRIYRENPAVRAIVHAHPVTATSFAIARVPLDVALMTESVIGLGVVPVAEYAVTGSPAIADSVAPFCRDYNALLLANHGAVTWGTDPLQAWYRMETLECVAQVMKNLGYLDRPAHVLTRAQVAELIAIREKLGVTAGDTPLCAEDLVPADRS